MNQLRIGTLVATFAGLTTLGISSSVLAQQPCGEYVCEPGFECQTSVAPCSGSCYETEDGEQVCEEIECAPEPYFSCARAACESDADCGDAMVCHTFEAGECSGSVSVDCDDDGNCEQVEQESTCTTTEYKQCAYRHELPCESDAQCGAGFACVEAESCWCEGSTSEDTPDEPEDDGDDDESNDEAAPDTTSKSNDDVTCGCEPSGEKYCQMNAIECEADADCPSGWTCELGAETCWGDENGVIGCERSPSSCYPPGRGGDTGSGGGDVGDNSDDDYDTTDDRDDWDEEAEGSGDEDDDGAPSHDSPPNAGVWGIWSLLGCSVKHLPATTNSGAWSWLAVAVGVTWMRRRMR